MNSGRSAPCQVSDCVRARVLKVNRSILRPRLSVTTTAMKPFASMSLAFSSAEAASGWSVAIAPVEFVPVTVKDMWLDCAAGYQVNVSARPESGKLRRFQALSTRAVAIRMTWTALPMTSAGRFAPVGVLGMGWRVGREYAVQLVDIALKIHDVSLSALRH